MQFALLTENKPVLRFLVTWGATCTAENLDELRKITLDQYPRYVALLHRCGLNLSAAEKTIAQDFNNAGAEATKPFVPRPIPPPNVHLGW